MKSLLLVICYLFFGISTSVAQDVTPKPIAPYTPAVMANGTLYLSGQIPRVFLKPGN